MAFSSTVTQRPIAFGNKRMCWGTWDGGGETGGNINTYLKKVEFMSVSAAGSSIVADAPTINETFPCDGSAVTIIVTSDTDGYWFAVGY